MGADQSESPIGSIFAVIGFLAGVAAGAEADSGCGAAFFGGVILAAIGYVIGRWVEQVLAYVFFIIVAIISFLINSAIRRAIFEALFQ